MPIDPLIGSSLISAGGNILGGFLGKEPKQTNAGQLQRKYTKRQNRRQLSFARQANRRQERFQGRWNRRQLRFAKGNVRKAEYQLKHGIQRRVKDAKKAGLHPLFALGANPGAFSGPSFSVGGTSPMGYQPNAVGGPNGLSYADSQYGFGDALSDIGNAAAGYFTASHARQIQAAQLELQGRQAAASIGLDESMASYYDALAAKTAQTRVTGPGDSLVAQPYGRELGLDELGYQKRPTEVGRSYDVQYNERGERILSHLPRGEEYGQVLNARDDFIRWTQRTGGSIGEWLFNRGFFK